VVLLSLPTAVLIATILFINQFQDYQADKAVGKRNWVVRLGRRRSAIAFFVLMSAWTLPILAGIGLGLAPALSLVALIPVAAAVKAIQTAARHYDHPKELTPANALTVITHLSAGLLLAGALVLQGCTDTRKSPGGGDAAAFGKIAEIRLSTPKNRDLADYLGVPADKAEFALTDIGSPILVVQLLDMYCTNCRRDVPGVNRLYELVQGSDLKNRVRFLGIGKGNTRTETRLYVERYEVPFPVFPDPEKGHTERLGTDRTPHFFILDLKGRKVLHRQWRLGSPEAFFEKLGGTPGTAETTAKKGLTFDVGKLAPVDSELAVKVGDEAPAFSLPSIEGKTVSLSDFKGKKHVVLSFVPAAWTPVCSTQWPGYDTARSAFEKRDAVVLGITADNVPTLFAWAKDMGNMWFPVLSDFWPHGKVARQYGVLRSDGTTERALFLIDKQGIIRYVDVHNINERPPLDTLLSELDKLRK
jgi:peroxiredoxin (alkyl hydroperoxide reductase subunit C)